MNNRENNNYEFIKNLKSNITRERINNGEVIFRKENFDRKKNMMIIEIKIET